MTPRFRVLPAVNRQRPDRVPKEAVFTPVALETVKKYIGPPDPGAYFKMEMRGVGFKGLKQQADFKAMIELFAPGLVLAPTHVLEPEVPWENIKAFFDATEEFGKLD